MQPILTMTAGIVTVERENETVMANSAVCLSPATSPGISPAKDKRGPLSGLRVVEFGHYIAGPFAARLLADLGAEVIKVEPPDGGDPARGWGLAIDGRSLWWSVHARNKTCITLDVKTAEGRELARRLIAASDAVLENFRPGQMERWGLGPAEIEQINPRCILTRISGFGQTGPYRERAAFGVIGEAIGGIRHLTAFPKAVSDLPPVRTGVSLSDSLAGLYAVIGLLAAVYQRDVTGSGHGRRVDTALYEAVFSLMEGCLTEYGALNVVREPSGSTLPTNAPSNAYYCADGNWLCIAGNSDRIFGRLAALLGQPDLASDPRFVTNRQRVAHAGLLDTIIGGWVAGLTSQEAEAALEAAEIPASRIYTIADCAADPHFHARGMIRTVSDPVFGPVLHPGIVPRFDGDNGVIAWAGPSLGQHNAQVYGGLLGLSAVQIEALRQARVI